MPWQEWPTQDGAVAAVGAGQMVQSGQPTWRRALPAQDAAARRPNVWLLTLSCQGSFCSGLSARHFLPSTFDTWMLLSPASSSDISTRCFLENAMNAFIGRFTARVDDLAPAPLARFLHPRRLFKEAGCPRDCGALGCQNASPASWALALGGRAGEPMPMGAGTCCRVAGGKSGRLKRDALSDEHIIAGAGRSVKVAPSLSVLFWRDWALAHCPPRGLSLFSVLFSEIPDGFNN